MTLPETLLLILVIESFVSLLVIGVGGFWVIRVLKDVKEVTADVENTTKDLRTLKNKVKNYLKNLFKERG